MTLKFPICCIGCFFWWHPVVFWLLFGTPESLLCGKGNEYITTMSSMIPSPPKRHEFVQEVSLEIMQKTNLVKNGLEISHCFFLVWIQHTTMNKEKRAPGCLVYIGDYTTQLCRGYFINHYLRIPINQPGFNGNYPRVFGPWRIWGLSKLVLMPDDPWLVQLFWWGWPSITPHVILQARSSTEFITGLYKIVVSQ